VLILLNSVLISNKQKKQKKWILDFADDPAHPAARIACWSELSSDLSPTFRSLLTAAHSLRRSWTNIMQYRLLDRPACICSILTRIANLRLIPVGCYGPSLNTLPDVTVRGSDSPDPCYDSESYSISIFSRSRSGASDCRTISCKYRYLVLSCDNAVQIVPENLLLWLRRFLLPQ
jgi:hypothetical protein